MSSQTPRVPMGLVLALALTLGLVGALPGTASGRPQKARAESFQEIGGFQHAWDWLTTLVSVHNPVQRWRRLWRAVDMGPYIDPDGRHTNADVGPLIDPDGRHTNADMGPLIDPDGRH
jgi:hypothetical protein